MKAWRAVFALVLSAGCTVPNASHCGNIDGDLTCLQRGTGRYCSVCEAANDGCVSEPVDGACLPSVTGITTEAASGEESTASTSAHTSTGADPTATVASSDGSTSLEDTSASTGDTQSSSESTTSGPATCGNDIAEGDEVCDGTDLRGKTCASEHLGTGELACGPFCDALDASGCSINMCGDGVVNAEYEQCDGPDLNGQTCAKHPDYGGGTLKCYPNCLFDYSDCEPCKQTGSCQSSDECCGALGCILNACVL